MIVKEERETQMGFLHDINRSNPKGYISLIFIHMDSFTCYLYNLIIEE
jgi:hypothetical protein